MSQLTNATGVARQLRIARGGTIASRVLGMARDMATAALLGGGFVMDSLVFALRFADLFRRLFGEGVLATSLIPVLAPRMVCREDGWKLISAVLTATAAATLAIVLLGEAVCGVWMWQASGDTLAIRLTAIVLPYLVWICLVAQMAAALHVLARFVAASFVSCVLNVGWLLACLLAILSTDNPVAQAHWLAWGVLVSGGAQVAVLWGALRRAGFRWRLEWRESLDDLRQVGRLLAPTAIALSVTQINTTVDGWIAWGYAGGADSGAALSTGAASAVYYGERLFMLPVGVFGVTLATVLHPRMSQLASEPGPFGAALEVALRKLWQLAIPAGAGLALLATPVVRLLFERGAFDAEATARTARVAVAYAVGIPFFAAAPLLVRAQVTLGRSWSAAALGLAACLLNGAVSLAVVASPAAEAGVAAATSLAAALQIALLCRGLRIPWSDLAPSLGVAVAATAAMLLIGRPLAEWTCCGAEEWLALRLAASIAVCLGAYYAALYGLNAVIRRSTAG